MGNVQGGRAAGGVKCKPLKGADLKPAAGPQWGWDGKRRLPGASGIGLGLQSKQESGEQKEERHPMKDGRSFIRVRDVLAGRRARWAEGWDREVGGKGGQCRLWAQQGPRVAGTCGRTVRDEGNGEYSIHWPESGLAPALRAAASL